MTIENTMVDGTKGMIESPPKVGTSRCPACGIRGRPGGPSLPGCCFRCRRSLPWIAAVLCRFEDEIHDLKCVWRIRGGLKAVEDYRNPRRYRDSLACRIVRERTGARTALSAWPGVALGCSLLRLVAATGKNLKRHL